MLTKNGRINIDKCPTSGQIEVFWQIPTAGTDKMKNARQMPGWDGHAWNWLSRNSNSSEGKQKAVQISGRSSYRDQFNIQFTMLQYTVIDGHWFFSTSVSSAVQI